ncbi:MAG: nitrogen regulation protein NR(I) [Candidatus Competibacteraceae bacterium]|uniref:DNA-binding transcriptional regulator NtrC n=1 Tax=Candidatus Contendobacter odensis Run_B_J11 TaxID=1400861 RepID=A0A7U7J618_9GAMM|nr:nitrogen regulation protein NR(I) [Candidatus Contendobacter odensis]MBK8537329.1 nitrogen regulation protein NR(I) [Candidatus Competibacteraceae bacterium]MBK8753668.1 nitrogen regulation protein NR(I) [Candidatus Competibacteraceae bacterium]CDH47072.1 response regulator in two-component regulatory system with GlnL, nitrogen regulation (EBP family) [Candidatus Contendobacter odensis Run_B_J11]
MIRKEQIWVIDDDHAIRWVLEKALQRDEMTVKSFDSAAGVIEALRQGRPDAIIADIRMPGMSGLELLARLRERVPDLPVIIMTAHSDLDSAVSAYQGGAFEYLPKPFDVDEAVALVRRACQMHRQKTDPPEQIEKLPEIVGEGPAMQEVFRAIGRLSHSNITVLITGESGTGKELVARALHRHSPRADKPFIAINTAAIPRDLLESELFGHERGAFTGAQTARQGRFEQANSGTLFLDEIGDMPAELQTRLLRVLAEGEFYRVGGHLPTRVDVRVIAATHQNLEQRVRDGLFRDDLYHRLNVIRIQLPSLSRRREDIPLLTRRFLGQAGRELGVESKILRPETETYLSRLDWPGNVRQLENLCRWLTVMASGREIHLEDLPMELRERSPAANDGGHNWETALRLWASQSLGRGEQSLLETALPSFERVLIQVALEQTGGHRQDAARLLGWGRNTLTRKIKELQLE